MQQIVLIGSSSGGPRALDEVITKLPANFPAPVIVFQHLPVRFTASLAKRLNTNSQIAVAQAGHEEFLEAERVYIVPGDRHLTLHGPAPELRIHLIESHETESPSIDIGFTSVAEHYGPGTIAVVLTGMGDDGTIGAKAVRQVGGRVLAQDEQTSAVYGMPQAVKDAGYADEIVPLQDVVPRLIQLTHG